MRSLLPLSFLLLPLLAQPVKITSGAVEYQVYQRGPGGAADITVSGSSTGKEVEASLLRQGRRIAGFKAAVENGQWTGVVRQAPAGGPYELAVGVTGARERAVVGHLLVGDLWILAGQSNMEGVGNLENLPATSPQVNSIDLTDKWGVAKDPLHRLVDAADRVHWRRVQGQPRKLEGAELEKYMAERKKGAGSGLPFALEMAKRTGVPVGLVPCAHGGTSMDQWSPSLKDQGGDSLYGAMVRRHQLVGGSVAGVLWYQGESDAGPKAAPEFQRKFEAFVAAVRTDFGQPDLPFYYVQIGRYVNASNPAEWNLVQNMQLKAESTIPNSGMVTCADCRLDDGIHVGTDDQQRLGARLANLADKKHKRGPRPLSVKANGNVITVEFGEINGKLVHAGNLYGFSVHDAEGKPLPLIYRQRVSAARPNVVELLFSGRLPEGAVLHYGAGKDPYVNLLDEADMAAPVFGPVPIAR